MNTAEFLLTLMMPAAGLIFAALALYMTRRGRAEGGAPHKHHPRREPDL
jgi:hypothetical protein